MILFSVWTVLNAYSYGVCDLGCGGLSFNSRAPHVLNVAAQAVEVFGQSNP